MTGVPRGQNFIDILLADGLAIGRGPPQDSPSNFWEQFFQYVHIRPICFTIRVSHFLLVAI